MANNLATKPTTEQPVTDNLKQAMHSSVGQARDPWTWVPSLYFFQGIPYGVVMITSGLIYKTMGVSIASLAFWTSLLYLPGPSNRMDLVSQRICSTCFTSLSADRQTYVP